MSALPFQNPIVHIPVSKILDPPLNTIRWSLLGSDTRDQSERHGYGSAGYEYRLIAVVNDCHVPDLVAAMVSPSTVMATSSAADRVGLLAWVCLPLPHEHRLRYLPVAHVGPIPKKTTLLVYRVPENGHSGT